MLGIKSIHSKQRLESLKNDNIRVIRHPDHGLLPLLWAHHEKVVVVDQVVAFLGGIDLCFGRWDTSRHRLTDGRTEQGRSEHDGEARQVSRGGIINSSRPGLPGLPGDPGQARNSITNLVSSRSEFFISLPMIYLASSNEEPKKVGLGEKLKNSTSGAIRSLTSPNKSARYSAQDEEEIEEGRDLLDGAVMTKPKVSDEMTREDAACPWPGKDFVNFIVRDVTEPDNHEADNSDRARTVRMPWHDVGVAVRGDAARDVAR